MGREPEVLWQFDLSTYGVLRVAVGKADAGGRQRDRIYFSDNGRLHALADDGRLAWVTPSEMGTGFGPPVVGPDGTVYAGHGALYAFSPSGELLWSLPVGVQQLVVDSEGTLYALLSPDAASGRRLAAGKTGCCAIGSLTRHINPDPEKLVRQSVPGPCQDLITVVHITVMHKHCA